MEKFDVEVLADLHDFILPLPNTVNRFGMPSFF
jgi:hypothetical protein